MAREPHQKIDHDASSEQHLRQIELQGQAYLARAAKQLLPAPTRQRILTAALKHLESRWHHTTSTQHLSQAASQSLNTATRPISGFETLLASLIDDSVSPQSLIEACARAADMQVAPILVKCLFVLASIGPITDHKALTIIRSQTQQQAEPDEDDLFGDDENRDPQRPSQLPANQVAVRRTGQSFVDEFVSQLADTPKSTQARSSAVFVASVAREAPLSETSAQGVLRLLTERMTAVQLLELPAFLYQLLLFASSRGTPAAKARVLLHIADVFSKREASALRVEAMSQSLLAEDEDAIVPDTKLSELRQVQGTALLHIEYAVKHDPALPAELVKLAKGGVETPRHVLTSFGTGIVLSLSRTASVQTDVLSMLRDVMLRFDKERRMRLSNLYMARVSINDDSLLDLRRSLLHIAECTCEVGWDYVKESLMRFSFVLLDKPLPTSGRKNGAECIATSLIFKLFNAHSSMREAILEQLTSRIALQEKSACQAICIISKLSDRIPFYVLEHSRFIRDGIELLVTLPPWMASDLMKAYRPLLLARPDLQDYFQLVIRKSLFHRDTSSRAVAIQGFIMSVSMCAPGAKTRTEVHYENGSMQSEKQQESELGMVMETIQPLRRVFSYSAALKAYWYMNIVSMFQGESRGGASSVAATATSEILKTHLLRFVDGTNAPYVLVDYCVDEQNGGRLTEPLGDLIWGLAVTELAAKNETYVNSFILDLARKLASVSYQDFGFLKEPMTAQQSNQNNNDDFEEGNARDEIVAARANRNKARSLGSVAEALIHSVLIIPKQAQEWKHYSEIVIPLLLLKENLFTVLREAGAGTVADAFDDLGGDLNIERVGRGMRMQLQRGGKSSATGKKSKSLRKGKSADSADNPTGNLQAIKHRFGVFNVLSSASARPTLPLHVTISIIKMMSDAVKEVDSPDGRDLNMDPNPFREQRGSRDYQDLLAYLLAVAHRHVEDFVSASSKSLREEPVVKSNSNGSEMGRSIRSLASIAMDGFRRLRGTPLDETSSRGMKNLQIVDCCAMASKILSTSKTNEVVSFCKGLMPAEDRDHLRPEEVYESSVHMLEELVHSLLDEPLCKEAMVALRVHHTLVETVIQCLDSIELKSAFLNKRIQWAVDTIADRTLQDPSIVKILVETCLLYTENNNDLRRAGQISLKLLKVLGDCDETADPPLEQPEFKLCNAEAIEQKTCLAAVDAVLDVLERGLGDVDWCVARMISLEHAANHGVVTEGELTNTGKKEKDDEAVMLEETAKQAIRAEDAAQIRLEGIVRTLSGLAKCAIGKWAQQERLLRLITKTYKSLSAVTQVQAKRRGDPRTSFVSLINECKGLAPTLWTYLSFVGADIDGETTRKGASKATREARVMPQLVYEVEKFEKVLIGAQKRTKISLLRGMRRNIARDFRIREDRLHDVHENDEYGEQNAANAIAEENDGNNQLSRTAKRRRTS